MKIGFTLVLAGTAIFLCGMVFANMLEHVMWLPPAFFATVLFAAAWLAGRSASLPMRRGLAGPLATSTGLMYATMLMFTGFQRDFSKDLFQAVVSWSATACYFGGTLVGLVGLIVCFSSSRRTTAKSTPELLPTGEPEQLDLALHDQ